MALTRRGRIAMELLSSRIERQDDSSPTLPLHRALAGLTVVALIYVAGWLAALLSAPPALRQSAGSSASIQHGLAFSASLALLIVGVFYLSFWLARRQEGEHLLLAITTVVWAVFNLQYVLPPAATGSAQMWQVAATQLLPIPWLNWLIYLFIAHLTPRRRPRWLERLLPGYVLGFSVAVLPVWPLVERWPLLPVWAYTLFGIMSVATIAVMVGALGRSERRVIQVACLYCIGAAAHDLMLRQGWLPPDRIALIPYTGLALLGSFTFTLQRRYVAALEAEEQAQAQLSLKLAQREEDLRRQHHRVLQLEREQAEQRERQRLMRDLHDGVGGLLTTSLMLAEQGHMSRDDMVGALRQAVDDLRTTIDVLQPEVQDLGELLANFRHRIGARIQAAGIELSWEISPEIDRLQFTSQQKLHVLRWLQEALTNALRHAQPRRLQVRWMVDANHRVHAGDDGPSPTWALEVQDDGIGFDVPSGLAADSTARLGAEPAGKPPGRGLQNLAQRARSMGAVCTFTSRPGRGTRLRLSRWS